MARAKSIIHLQDQRMRLVDELSQRTQKSFEAKYKTEVQNYRKNYKNPQYKEAYAKAMKEFSNSKEFKDTQKRMRKIAKATDRYIANIKKSEDYKQLKRDHKQAVKDYKEASQYRDYGYTDSLAHKANDIQWQMSHNAFSQEARMGNGAQGLSNG